MLSVDKTLRYKGYLIVRFIAQKTPKVTLYSYGITDDRDDPYRAVISDELTSMSMCKDWINKHYEEVLDRMNYTSGVCVPLPYSHKEFWEQVGNS